MINRSGEEQILFAYAPELAALMDQGHWHALGYGEYDYAALEPPAWSTSNTDRFHGDSQFP